MKGKPKLGLWVEGNVGRANGSRDSECPEPTIV